MNTSVKALIVTAAVSGLLGGASLCAQAETSSAQPGTNTTISQSSLAGTPVSMNQSNSAVAKHSCKGKNDCKGQGGCKSSDNGCKAKNSCKGKGGCATDGSKMPK